MKLLEKYIEAFNAGDAEKMGALFCEDGVFDDQSVALVTGEPGYFNGREAVTATFREIFKILPKPTATLRKIYPDGRQMEYEVVIGKTRILSLGSILEEENGKLKRYRCEPIRNRE